MIVSVFGLGTMGFPMARNLLKNGFMVKCFDASKEMQQRAKEAGLTVCDDEYETVKDANFVHMVLPSPTSVLEVAEKVVSNLNSNAVLIDHSTIDLESASKLHSLAQSAGISCLDAPISGAQPRAEDGSLTIMVGGETKDVDRSQQVLRAIGKEIIHCGPAGNGQAVKLCNNMMLGLSIIGLSESFALGKKLGVEPKVLHEVISKSSGNCWALQNYCPEPGMTKNAVPADGDYLSGFPTKMMVKDMSLAVKASQFSCQPIPLTVQALNLYENHSNDNGASLDYSSIIKYIEKLGVYKQGNGKGIWNNQSFTVCHADLGKFESQGLRSFFEYRQLNIAEATDGSFGAHVVRAIPGKETPGKWHKHVLDFQMVYVLKGWVKFEYEHVGESILREGSCVLQPPGILHREIAHSDDLELLEITAPAAFETVEV